MMVIQQVYVTIYKQDTFRYVQTRYDIHEDMVMLYCNRVTTRNKLIIFCIFFFNIYSYYVRVCSKELFKVISQF